MNDLSLQFTGAPSVDTLLEGQGVVLEKIAQGAPLSETLESLVALVERSGPGMRCAVLLKVENEPRLRIAAAPNLPEDYRRRIEPFLEIGPDMGASGTAAYRGVPVYHYDTAVCQAVSGLAAIAARNGLHAVWSTPILSNDGQVLGTFAVYYDKPQLPTEHHLRLIAMATQIARIAIQAGSHDRLFGYWFGPTIVTDLQGTIVRVEDAFAKVLGYSAPQLRGRNISMIAPSENYDSLVARLLSPRGYIRGARRYRTQDGRDLIVGERRAILRDAAGRARLVVALMESNVEADKHPLSRLSQREREVLELVAAGHTSREIAAQLHLAPPSVATYRSRVMTKLGLKHMAGLMRFAIDNGIYQNAA